MANNVLLANDSFTSGSLAAGWSALPTLSKCQVVAGSPNVTETNSPSVTAGQLWTGLTWPNDQTSEFTVNILTSGTTSSIGLAVRLNATTLDGYLAVFTPGVGLKVYTAVGGVLTQLSSTVTGMTVSAGDVLYFQVAGAYLSYYQNNALRFQYYDTTHTAGYPGYDQNSSAANSDSQISSWRGYSAGGGSSSWLTVAQANSLRGIRH